MPYVSDSDSDGEMPTLDALFQAKRAVVPPHPPAGRESSVLPPSTSTAAAHRKVDASQTDISVRKGKVVPSSSSAPCSPEVAAHSAAPTRPITTPAPTRVPLRPLPSAQQPVSPKTPSRPIRRARKGATSAELLAQDERTGYHQSPGGVVQDELLIVEYATDSEQDTSSAQSDTSTDDDTATSESETGSSSSSGSPSSDISSAGPPRRTANPGPAARTPRQTAANTSKRDSQAHDPRAVSPTASSTPRVPRPAPSSGTPTQFPQSRYRPKGFATSDGYRNDPFFDPAAYVVLTKPAPSVQESSQPAAESSRTGVSSGGLHGGPSNGQSLSDTGRRRIAEKKLALELEEKEVVPATDSEGSASSEDERGTRRQESPPALGQSLGVILRAEPIASSSSSAAFPEIDIPSTPRAKSRRPRPTHLFGSYVSTPLAKPTTDFSSDGPSRPAALPASPFIDLTDSPAGTPRRKKGKAPRPTELFQFISRERRLPDNTSASDRVERRKSGRGCWIGEAVEEVRAIESDGDGQDGGEGVLTMLDETTQLEDAGNPLPTWIASTSTLPTTLHTGLPSNESATLTSFRGGRRVILDSDDEVETPPLGSPLSRSPPPVASRGKGKGYQTIIHELSDSSSSDTGASPSREEDVQDDYWGGQASTDPSSGVLSFSPPPPPTSLPPRHPISSSPPSPTPIVLDSPAPSPAPRPKAPRPRPRANVLPPARQPTVKITSKAWKTHRAALALDLVGELDKAVFERKVAKWLRLDDTSPERKDEPRGIVWTGKLRTTAGMSRWCRKKCAREEGGYEHFCKIELSAKVLDSDDKILSTTAHELCHLATWIFDGKDAAPHGKEFKSWAKKINRYRPDIVVTTRHDYEITHKFTWKCAGCDATYGRDSRSIDTSRQCCGKCKGRLVAQHPDASTATPSKPNPYRDFLKEHFKSVQTSSPGASQADVMRLLGEKWRVEKQRREAESERGIEGLTGGLKGMAIEVD